MATKLVQPLRMDEEQDPNFEYPIPLLPNSDGVAASGFFPQNASSFDQLTGVERDAAQHLLLKDPVSSRKLVDLLLETDPDSSGTTYVVAYTGNRVTQELWKVTSTDKTIKTIDYTYDGSKISTEVRKVYAADGSTIVAQQSITYSYAGSKISGSVATRDV